MTKHVIPTDTEDVLLELNFKKCKWLLVGAYNPPPQNDHDIYFDIWELRQSGWCI